MLSRGAGSWTTTGPPPRRRAGRDRKEPESSSTTLPRGMAAGSPVGSAQTPDPLETGAGAIALHFPREPMPGRLPKIFVLDTSVILYDFNAILNFQEHDVAVPITVLEELDQFKKGNSVLNLQAREFIRQLDRLSTRNMLAEWIPLDGAAHGRFRVLTEESSQHPDSAEVFGSKKADHRILTAVLSLTRREPDRKVVLVTKDINLRLKARALSPTAHDYETVQNQDLQHLDN